MERGREDQDWGEEYNVGKKEKGKQNHLLYNIKAVGKNIKWERGLKFRGRISSCRELDTPLGDINTLRQT